VTSGSLPSCGGQGLGEIGDEIIALVGRLRGSEADAREIASLIVTQTVSLAYTRYVLKLPPLVAMPHETTIKAIGATIQRYLTEPLPDDDGGA
jgi:hypothetical protein